MQKKSKKMRNKIMNFEQWRFFFNLWNGDLLKNYNNTEIAKFIGVSSYTVRNWRTEHNKMAKQSRSID